MEDTPMVVSRVSIVKQSSSREGLSGLESLKNYRLQLLNACRGRA